MDRSVDAEAEAQARVEQFKAMLAERRATALAAFKAEDGDCVERWRACRPTGAYYAY